MRESSWKAFLCVFTLVWIHVCMLAWFFLCNHVCFCARTSAGGAAAGGQCVLLSGVAELAGSGSSSCSCQQGACVSVAFRREWGSHCRTQHDYHRAYLQVRFCSFWHIKKNEKPSISIYCANLHHPIWPLKGAVEVLHFEWLLVIHLSTTRGHYSIIVSRLSTQLKGSFFFAVMQCFCAPLSVFQFITPQSDVHSGCVDSKWNQSRWVTLHQPLSWAAAILDK